MSLRVYITTEVFDRDGKLVRGGRRRRRSHSFVKAFLAILLAQMKYDTTITGILDTGGTSRDLTDNAVSFKDLSGASSAILGIVVGTGTTAVAVTDYKLETLIEHGVTTDKLNYLASYIGSLVVSDPNASFTLYRDFLNQSGATITVYEEGLYVQGFYSQAAYFCVIRDVEATGVAVADGQNLRVTYTIQTST